MYRYLYFILFLSVVMGCSSSEDLPSEEQPDAELSLAERTNVWIYSHMDHYYLWREDLPDSLSCDFTLTPTAFFESLLSDKDRFSYVGFSSRSGRAATLPDYGFAYQRMVDAHRQEYLYVLYVTSPSVRQEDIARGDLLRAHHWGEAAATFDVMQLHGSSLSVSRSVTLDLLPTSRAASKNETVYLDSVYTVNDKKVGYLCYLEFDQALDFYESMQKFEVAGIDELILDLRYNPGGYENTCKTLCNAIVSSSAYEDIFVQHSYNEIVAAENLARYGDERTYSYFNAPREYEGNVMGEICPFLNLDRVYVLTSKNSASCSELAIISLRPYMDVVVIGENSTGKGVGMNVVSVPDFNYELAPITFRFYNVLNETVPDTGIEPDYYVPDGYSTLKRDLGNWEEPLLHCALNLIGGSTPVTRQSMIPGKDYTSLLTPIGEPSYVTEYHLKHHRYED